MVKKRQKKFDSKKYVRHRRKLLKEVMKLVYERDRITRDIRKIRKDLRGWDNYLVNGDPLI